MALDRQSIQRTDFPLGSHGYDPQAVDAHLSSLADEVDEFKSAARRRSESLAASAADQVRAIIEAAESSAAEIQREAESEAREIREEAQQEARSTREHASEQVREHVGRVAEATTAMQSRLDGMESELSALIDSLRSGSSRLDGDLRQLESDLGNVRQAATPEPQEDFRPDPPPAPPEPEPTYDPGWSEPTPVGEPGGYGEPSGYRAEDHRTDSHDQGSGGEGYGDSFGGESSGEGWPPESHGGGDPFGAPETGESEPEPAAEAPPEPAVNYSASEGDPQESGSGPLGAPSRDESVAPGFVGFEGGSEDASAGQAYPEPAEDNEGARLIALNMALNGTPREETERYLADNFRLSDRAGLLDEVYASVEG